MNELNEIIISSLTAAEAELPPCELKEVFEAEVSAARASLPREDIIFTMAETFGALGEPTRIKLIAALMPGELCVCDMAELLQISQPAVSHHLKLLKGARLIKYRREGKRILYSIDDEHIRELFTLGKLHAEEREL